MTSGYCCHWLLSFTFLLAPAVGMTIAVTGDATTASAAIVETTGADAGMITAAEAVATTMAVVVGAVTIAMVVVVAVAVMTTVGEGATTTVVAVVVVGTTVVGRDTTIVAVGPPVAVMAVVAGKTGLWLWRDSSLMYGVLVAVATTPTCSRLAAVIEHFN